MKTKRITDECGQTHYFDGDSYRGWEIGYGGSTVTGRFKAMRYGVGISAGTRDALVRSIDQRIADDDARREARA